MAYQKKMYTTGVGKYYPKRKMQKYQRKKPQMSLQKLKPRIDRMIEDRIHLNKNMKFMDAYWSDYPFVAELQSTPKSINYVNFIWHPLHMLKFIGQGTYPNKRVGNMVHVKFIEIQIRYIQALPLPTLTATSSAIDVLDNLVRIAEIVPDQVQTSSLPTYSSTLTEGTVSSATDVSYVAMNPASSGVTWPRQIYPSTIDITKLKAPGSDSSALVANTMITPTTPFDPNNLDVKSDVSINFEATNSHRQFIINRVYRVDAKINFQATLTQDQIDQTYLMKKLPHLLVAFQTRNNFNTEYFKVNCRVHFDDQ